MVRNFAVAILALGFALPARAATEPTLGIVQAAYDREHRIAETLQRSHLLTHVVVSFAGQSDDEIELRLGDAAPPGQLGSLDETLWRFAVAPGIEFVDESDDCFQSTGLRLAR